MRSAKKAVNVSGLAARCGMALALAGVLSACTSLSLPWSEPTGGNRPETVWAVTANHELIHFNAGQPGKLLSRRPLQGLSEGEVIVGIDYRVARGVLYALSSAGRLYTLDTVQARLNWVPAPLLSLSPQQAHGFDFNPTVDRIRVISEDGRNMRVHPDTGALVDGDPAQAGVQPDGALRYADATVRPRVAGMAYTYNTRDDKLTTGYAIDMSQGTLVTLGSAEGVSPVVSPNGGMLFKVGGLGLGPLREVSFDISDVRNTALAAVVTQGEARTRLYRIDLRTGQASLLGTVGQGQSLRGVAIEP